MLAIMHIQNIESSDPLQHIDAGEERGRASGPLSTSSSICSMDAAPGCCCIDRMCYFLSQFFTAIWDRLFLGPPLTEDQLQTLTSTIRTFIANRVDFSEVANLEYKAAMIIKCDDEVIALHHDTLTRESFESFKGTAIQKMEEALSRRPLRENNELCVAIIFLHNRGEGGFYHHKWEKWASLSRGNGAGFSTGQHTRAMAQGSLSRYTNNPDLIQFMLG